MYKTPYLGTYLRWASSGQTMAKSSSISIMHTSSTRSCSSNSHGQALCSSHSSPGEMAKQRSGDHIACTVNDVNVKDVGDFFFLLFFCSGRIE